MKQAILELLKSCRLFQGMDEEALQFLSTRFKPVVFKEGFLIFTKGDEGQNLYLISKGRVKIFLQNANGKNLLLNVCREGDFFGEVAVLDRKPRSASAAALTEVTAFEIDRARLFECMFKFPVISINIIELLGYRLRYTTQHTEMLVLFDATARLAAKLLEQSEASRADSLTVTITQDELGEGLSLTRVWISRLLKNFAELKVIQLSRGKITITNVEKLRYIAEQ